MKYCSRKILIAGSIIFTSLTAGFGQSTINTIKVKSAKSCHTFFSYTGKEIPIVSGHRGASKMPGFPENCIETFQEVLRHTPAFFEIDPRLTKDSVMVLMHDATLDRTTNGTGKVSDYTWEELQQFRLKDINGKVTDFRIPTLEAVIEWARGKTIVNLDKKDVPPAMTTALVKRLKAESFVMFTVHNPEQASYFLKAIPSATFSAHALTKKAVDEYDKAGFPWKQSIIYIGPKFTPENKELLELIHARGATCMISAAPSFDKLKDADERKQAYIDVFNDGADILESDLPVEVGEAVKSIIPAKSKKKKFFGTTKVKN